MQSYKNLGKCLQALIRVCHTTGNQLLVLNSSITCTVNNIMVILGGGG